MLPIKLIRCPNHEKIKTNILREIDNTDRYQIEHDGDGPDSGPLTDWERNDEEKLSEYVRIFFKHAEQEILDVVKYEYGVEYAQLTNYWYQQYTETLTHGWHFHGGCLYHAIYYLELPEDAPPTMCRLPGGFEFTPNAQEGDILIMSSCIEHCSPPNSSQDRKSIIAVNIDNNE